MKLARYDWRMVIDWPENNVPVLAIESAKRFRRAIAELAAQAEGGSGDFVLSQEMQPLPLGKRCEVISDPIRLEFNDRASQAALAKWAKAIAVSPQYDLLTREVCQRVLAWAEAIALESEEPLSVEAEIDFAQLIKLCGLRFDTEEMELPEKICRRMRIAQSFLNKDCFIFVNLKRYLDREELSELYRSAFYRKMRVMLIENLCPEIDKTYETAWIIDKDDCEIYPDEV